MSRTCATCHEELPIDSFRKVGKYRSRSCRRCISRQWSEKYHSDPEFRAAHNARGRANNAAVKAEVMTHYSSTSVPSCACCGVNYAPFLTVDHTDGNGADHRRSMVESRGTQYRAEFTGNRFYRWLKANGFPPGYRILCWNCNHDAHMNDGVCQCPSKIQGRADRPASA